MGSSIYLNPKNDAWENLKLMAEQCAYYTSAFANVHDYDAKSHQLARSGYTYLGLAVAVASAAFRIFLHRNLSTRYSVIPAFPDRYAMPTFAFTVSLLIYKSISQFKEAAALSKVFNRALDEMNELYKNLTSYLLSIRYTDELVIADNFNKAFPDLVNTEEAATHLNGEIIDYYNGQQEVQSILRQIDLMMLPLQIPTTDFRKQHAKCLNTHFNNVQLKKDDSGFFYAVLATTNEQRGVEIEQIRQSKEQPNYSNWLSWDGLYR